MKSRLPLLLAAAGVLLRILPVWAMPPWYDENFSILVSRLPLDRLIAATAGDVHPPLWYLLCWPLAHIPSIPPWMAVRLPSLLAGIACIWVWWKILNRTSVNISEGLFTIGSKARLTAFGLFCLLPQQVYYSQEGRMYSLLTLLVLLAWYCILTRRWIWLAVVTSAMLWLHNYGLLYAAALWLAAVIHDRRTWKPMTLALGIAGISFLPWVGFMLRQMGGIEGNYWILRFSIPSVMAVLAHTYFGTVPMNADMLSLAVFFGVLAWTVIWSLRHRTLNLPAVTLAFLPLVLAALVSLVWQPVMLGRALIPSGAFIALLLAEPVEYMQTRPLLLAGIFFFPALAVNLGMVELRSVWGGDLIRKGDHAIALVDSQWREGDLLYYADDGVFVSGSVTWKNIDNALQVERCGPVKGGLSPQTEDALGLRSGPLPENVPGRIWVISGETPLNPTCMDDYLLESGLLDSEPLYCSQDNELVRSCLYLVER